VIKHDTEERRTAMFKDNKLRLLMTLVGFTRLGEHHDAEATWVVPSSLTSTQLQESINLIRKFEFAPPTYEDGKAPEELLRSKAAASRRSTRRVDFDDDSDDGIDRDSEEDHGEYAKAGPTERDADGEPRKKLKRRRQQRTPVELDDDEKDRRAEARRMKEIEKQAKALSTMFVHDSDDEDWDAEKDAAFFAREQAIREDNLKTFKKSLVLGSIEPVAASKKRKADMPAKKGKRLKSPPKRKVPFDDSDDDMEDAASSRAPSETAGNLLDNAESEDEATDTPLSSQNAGAAAFSDANTPRKSSQSATKSNDVAMADADTDDDDEDEDDMPVARKSAGRNMRAGFVIDSDSE
jgi:replication fork protection complex subunit Tof1/Swi1